MLLQGVTPTLPRDRRIGASQIQFIHRAATANRPVQKHNVATGRVAIATPETTILDMIESADLAAGLGNVGNLVGELALEGLIDDGALTDAASGYPTAVGQRASWLIDHMAGMVGASVELDPLAESVAARDYTLLDPRSPADGPRDTPWRVVVHTDVGHDL